jgi:hypothetical protein
MVKRAANHLATGRLIMALAIGGEDNSLHAYGYSLVQNALRWLESIACGDFDIPGAVLNEDTQSFTSRGPKIGNVDSSSGVENFYGQVMAPPLLINPIQDRRVLPQWLISWREAGRRAEPPARDTSR